MTRNLLGTSTALLIGMVTPAIGHSSLPFCGAAMTSMAPARPNVAVRRLEARTEKNGTHAWMDVRTAFTADGRFTYEVLQQGGSEQIRDRALLAALKREQELIGKGVPVHMPALLAGYDCAEPRPDADGLVRVSIRPREPNRHLVDGTLLLEPWSGAVVRVAGRLSKNPSFWVSEVQMDWMYTRLGDVVLPAAVHARAKVRIVGPATFDMTYRYISVDGQQVSGASAPAVGEGRN